MIDHATIEAIRQVAQIPTERRLWSIATIAEYAELSPSHVAQTIVGGRELLTKDVAEMLGIERSYVNKLMRQGMRESELFARFSH